MSNARCKGCGIVEGGRSHGQRVYGDAVVEVFVARDGNGVRALWVLPREPSKATAEGGPVRAHMWKTAARAARAMEEAGWTFAMGGAAITVCTKHAHASLRVPAEVATEESGIHRLPPEVPSPLRHLRPA